MSVRILDNFWLRLFSLGLIFSAISPGAVAGVAHTAKIEGMKYVPDHLTVTKGDTIIWKNLDIVSHTVTSLEKGDRLESGEIAPNKQFKWKVRSLGNLNYFCRFHPVMKGSLTVTGPKPE